MAAAAAAVFSAPAGHRAAAGNRTAIHSGPVHRVRAGAYHVRERAGGERASERSSVVPCRARGEKNPRLQCFYESWISVRACALSTGGELLEHNGSVRLRMETKCSHTTQHCNTRRALSCFYRTTTSSYKLTTCAHKIRICVPEI